jgi:hypothetical protein
MQLSPRSCSESIAARQRTTRTQGTTRTEETAPALFTSGQYLPAPWINIWNVAPLHWIVPGEGRSQNMNDLQKRIDQLEARSLESQLIADLATDPEARLYNTALARELMGQAARLRMKVSATA